MRIVCTLVAAVLLSTAAFAESLSVTTFAGTDAGPGYRDGVGTAARFQWPGGLAVDRNGNIIVADQNAHTIRHITPAGVVTTLAGVGGESGTTNGKTGVARFGVPRAVAVDTSGNVYVAEQRLRKISPSGVVTTLHNSIPTSLGMAVDSSGNVFLTDLFGNTIRKVTPGGVMSTFVSALNGPRAMTIDGSNNLYFTSGGGIYKCTPLGVQTQIAGIGGDGIAVDASGNVYVSSGLQIFKVTPNGTVTTLAGTMFQGHQDGPGSTATFLFVNGLGLSPDGSLLYVADQGNDAIRAITLPGAVVSTFAGKANGRGYADGTGLAAQFSNPTDSVLAPDGNLYVTDTFNNRIRKITPAGVVTTFVGGTRGNMDGTGTSAQLSDPTGIAVGDDGGNWVFYVTDLENDNVRKITQAGVVTTVATGMNGAYGVAVAADGDVYVSETYGHTIKRIDMPSGTVTVVAGFPGTPDFRDGTGTSAYFQYPAGIALDGSGNLFVADSSNNRIRQVVLATGVVTTYAGSGLMGSDDGTGGAATFYAPVDVHLVGSDLYVSDGGNEIIRRIEPGAVVTTVAGKPNRDVNRDGTGDLARFTNLAGIGGDSSTNLYICDLYSNNVRKARVPGIADVATASNTAPLPLTVVQLDTEPDTATSWTWSIDRRPTGSVAELSSTTVRNPTFTPDVNGLYTFLLRAEGPGGIRYSTVDVTASSCADPLASVVASASAAAVCVSGTNGTATVNVTGGTTHAYQWGYRTTPGGAITQLGGETSSTYTIDGTDFGGTGTRYLVVTVTPGCGVPTVSNELTLEVTHPADATISASSGVFASSTKNFASVPDAGPGATYTWGITNGTISGGQGSRSLSYTAGASGVVALTVTVTQNGCVSGGNVNVPIQARPAGATMLYIVTPCRVADTRESSAIAHAETRNFLMAGVCGIPTDAKAVVANVTAVGPLTDGWLALWPAGTTWGGTSTMNYRLGRTRANNAVIPLPNDGYVSVLNSGGPQHLILDVTGYFR
ncbi:MAG TPA: NHL repeat-containing protein [Thermoanaerobaculia bacterium]|nr:NHL repeat-containing protein [Thermoanaerobaculia bacterium]